MIHALRAASASLRGNPFEERDCLDYCPDALVVVAKGRIQAVGPYEQIRPTLPADATVTAHENALIIPGFIDTHVHYPQLGMIGAFGEQLLQWLDRYTYPAELAFADLAHAQRAAALFLRELVRNGTTTAAVYCTVHPQSVDAFFAAATSARGGSGAGTDAAGCATA